MVILVRSSPSFLVFGCSRSYSYPMLRLQSCVLASVLLRRLYALQFCSFRFGWLVFIDLGAIGLRVHIFFFFFFFLFLNINFNSKVRQERLHIQLGFWCGVVWFACTLPMHLGTIFKNEAKPNVHWLGWWWWRWRRRRMHINFNSQIMRISRLRSIRVQVNICI